MDEDSTTCLGRAYLHEERYVALCTTYFNLAVDPNLDTSSSFKDLPLRQIVMGCILSWLTRQFARPSRSISIDTTLSQLIPRSTEPSPSTSEPMASNLSEPPPVFHEEPTLCQLPFFFANHVDGYDLPPRPPSVCQGCWEGPFAMHFGLPCVSPRDGQCYRDWPEEIRYSISLNELKSRAGRECVWCSFVHSEGTLCAWDSPEWIITVRGTARYDENWGHGQYYQEIALTINGMYLYRGTVYTAPGALGHMHAFSRTFVRWRS